MATKLAAGSTAPPSKRPRLGGDRPNGDRQPPYLSHLPGDILTTHILPFLGANDVGKLGHSSRGLRSSLPTPRLVREGRRDPTKMAFVPCVEDCRTTVYQVQRFRFLVATSDFAWYEATIALSNAVWQERHNDRETHMLGPHEEFPQPTKVCATVNMMTIRPKRVKKGVQVFGTIDPRMFDGLDGFSSGHDEYLRYSSPPGRGLFLPKSMGSLYEGAKWIELFRAPRPPQGGDASATAFPTARYIMQQLPQSTHEHLPSGEDWTTKDADRDVRVEWEYRPAPKLDDWYKYCLPSDYCDTECKEYGLTELPWYRSAGTA